MKKYLLGIDVGTTGTKTMLFMQDGSCIAHAYQGYPTQTPHVGWSEQNPLDWWQAVVDTVRKVCDGSQNVVAISLSVQGGTTVPVDDKYQPVRPAMVWNDSRCETQKQQFAEAFGADAMYRKTGWHLFGGMNAMQIRWMKDNEPENFQKTAMFLSVPDYIAYKMTGIAALDPSNIGINQLGNIVEKRYDPQILQFAGIPEEKLPRIIPSGTVIGHLTADAAKELGLCESCVLVAGAHDQYAVALGAGAVNDGDILIGSGTCWVVTCIRNDPDFDSGLSQSVSAVPGKWGSLRSLSSGGVCLDWIRQKVLSSENELLSYEEINEETAKHKAAEEGLFFYPFSGMSSDTKELTKATFTGLDLSHNKFHLIRAVMEGVVFQIVWMMEAFHAKPTEDGLILSGGASKSKLWTQLLADISGYPIRIPELPDLACVGAAILAGMGAGLYESAAQGCKAFAVNARTVYPDSATAQKYRQLLSTYKRKAKALEDT